MVDRLTAIALGLAPALGGCAGAPAVATEDPLAAMELVEMQLEQGADADGYAIMSAIDEDVLTGRDFERYKLLWATCLHQVGSSWKAYKVIRDFQEVHRFSDFAPQVETLHFRVGETLIQSETSYWIFGSDKDDGEIVLSEFVTRYSTNVFVPDALKLTGELAFDEQRYYIARERFKRILSEYPSSEWAALAHFRLAMAGFLALVGPEYDAEEMGLSRNELRDYLATNPERPEFREAATNALAEVEDWLALRFVINAAFYARIGNPRGELHHLRLLVANYPDHRESAVARERIREIENATTTAEGADR